MAAGCADPASTETSTAASVHAACHGLGGSAGASPRHLLLLELLCVLLLCVLLLGVLLLGILLLLSILLLGVLLLRVLLLLCVLLLSVLLLRVLLLLCVLLLSVLLGVLLLCLLVLLLCILLLRVLLQLRLLLLLDLPCCRPCTISIHLRRTVTTTAPSLGPTVTSIACVRAVDGAYRGVAADTNKFAIQA
jgi:hypothetical protein